jgi:hypothetical protein
MKYLLKAKKKIAKAIGRSILSMNLTPALYFLILGITYIHTVKSFVNSSSSLYLIVKWFDPFIFVSPTILTYVFLPPILLTALSLLLQIVWIFQDHCMETSVFKHYIIKISTISAFVISKTMALPII